MPRATAWPPGVHPSGFSPSLVVLHIHSRLHLMSTLMAAIYHGVTLAFRLPRNVYLWHPAIHHEGAPLGRHPFPGLSLSPEVLARFSCLALPPAGTNIGSPLRPFPFWQPARNAALSSSLTVILRLRGSGQHVTMPTFSVLPSPRSTARHIPCTLRWPDCTLSHPP